MKKIRVLIVDDSMLMRVVLSDLLSRDQDIEIIGTAVNGKIGLEKVEALSPDIVTLDIEMPEMDGLTALSEIKKKHPKLPVIMCSSLTMQGGKATLEALNRGADDYMLKPVNGTSGEDTRQQFGAEFIYKIKELTKNTKKFTAPMKPEIKPLVTSSPGTERIDIVTIGTSTGGPNALSTVLPEIPIDFPVPIVIVQHMPAIFTKILAESLSAKCAIPVHEAQEGDILLPGHAWIAPGNYHMTLNIQNNHHVLKLNQDPQENYCRPAVDVLFRSVAKIFKQNALAIVMTGMGQDGLKGCQMIREFKGQIITQDEASSVVWGMPGAISKAGLADQILPLQNIGLAIIRQVNRKRALS